MNPLMVLLGLVAIVPFALAMLWVLYLLVAIPVQMWRSGNRKDVYIVVGALAWAAVTTVFIVLIKEAGR